MRDSRDYSALRGFSVTYLTLLGTLVLFIVLMGVIFVVLARQNQQNEVYFKNASEQRLLSRAIVTEALEAARGKETAFTKIKDSRDRFEQALNDEKNGNASLGLPPSPEAIQPYLAALESRWKPIRTEIDTILAGRDPVVSVSNFVPLLESSLTRMIALSDDIAKSLANNRVDPRQVYLATNQLLLGQRIESDLKLMLTEGGLSAAAAADRFSRNVSLFGRVLKGMREGDARLGIDRVNIADSAGKLSDLAELFKSLEAETARIVEKSPELVKVQNAARSIADKGDTLLEATTKLLEQYTEGSRDLRVFGIPLNYQIAYLLGFIALVLLLVLFYVQNRESRQRLIDSENRKQETEEQNRRNQDAILRLLDELGNLAEGDLTVQASVTEDITGAIADSVNYAIEALRDLVSTINNTSGLVAAAVQETSAIADRLAKSSEIQARQIENVSATVMQMAQSMDEVSTKTAASAEVAEKSVGIAHEGGDRVRHTIHGMNVIREHIQDTSKRIKRLGESSQEIGDIVALINDIADQTNILALNAAIQASAAGDAGRGFAVVADEVQRLAERSSNATKRIETLVKTIQADTNEAVISMEKSTAEVVGGAGLAEKAGEALDEIEKVSAKLAELIDEISKSAGQVSEMASRVSTAMISINEITGQTAESSVATASAIGTLNQLAQELRQSVAGFRLPD
ncbi:MAG: type IV pili methyl-accepting chemotaxis transducer N-terminal domain-containing protein [Candidatus Competibacteraceae bacterium]|uniref:Methyl-accepting chemotaxis sensory transducer n=1 Tax=Candidatus Contendobacter odensis Run_B_J11 TaxID=1400861 RepID=A0A7U7J507_9GAMM|nr:methyl-accepting chemotaxis protein [Candidatus Contendobacter odensis]MBK8534207.1 type IV pili methyl-accepting chemotaxis transducer N-terminal domain-containing protein [Candidatus Competibacteraceae bacterium]MBK8752018.1 type IV pili methyl-accepting chemotaxis transducer N-terminal domain-containing protein [Candidatus Competibacteraceae bacterium]CDH45786.1 putative methyl-accepting chemotaxis sensory transducer [Candidatus Contendobacter odensis Run_B_J11]